MKGNESDDKTGRQTSQRELNLKADEWKCVVHRELLTDSSHIFPVLQLFSQDIFTLKLRFT